MGDLGDGSDKQAEKRHRLSIVDLSPRSRTRCQWLVVGVSQLAVVGRPCQSVASGQCQFSVGQNTWLPLGILVLSDCYRSLWQ